VGFIKRSSPANSDFWLAMVDLDSFKTIDDTCGHPAGDTVMRAVAAELDKITGQSEHAIRLGDDEFRLFLRATSEQHAIERLEAICRLLRTKTVSAGNRPIPFSVSIGITPNLDGDLDSALAAPMHGCMKPRFRQAIFRSRPVRRLSRRSGSFSSSARHRS
jgi:diguanylate cyclase (GGDEF)-like protein